MIKLPNYQKSVIIGLLLSDGWLIFSAKRSINARLGFKQSLHHVNYVWFVFNLLSHYCSSFPIPVISKQEKLYHALAFFTRSLPCFTELHSMFYSTGVKVIPKNIYELLTPVALAHMIMGDGTGSWGRGVILCTDSFTISDTIILMNVLMIRYGLNCTLHRQRENQYRIYIRKNSMEKLVTIVKKHMCPSMMYKLNKSFEKDLRT